MLGVLPFPPSLPELSGSPGALPSAAGPLQHRGQRRDARAQRFKNALKSGILLWEDREKPLEVSPLLKSTPLSRSLLGWEDSRRATKLS